WHDLKLLHKTSIESLTAMGIPMGIAVQLEDRVAKYYEWRKLRANTSKERQQAANMEKAMLNATRVGRRPNNLLENRPVTVQPSLSTLNPADLNPFEELSSLPQPSLYGDYEDEIEELDL